MINKMAIPRELAIEWVVETKAISAFTRNFVEWLYRNGFFVGNNGCNNINFEMGKKIDEWWTKESGKTSV